MGARAHHIKQINVCTKIKLKKNNEIKAYKTDFSKHELKSGTHNPTKTVISLMAWDWKGKWRKRDRKKALVKSVIISGI